MNISFIKRMLVIVLSLCMLLSFCACKESKKLQRYNYVSNAEVDKNHQQNNNDEQNDIEDDSLSARKNKDSVEKKDLSYENETPTETVENEEEEGNANGPSGAGTSDEISDEGTEAVTSAEDTNEESNGENEQVDIVDDESTVRQIVDATGKTVEIPKNVSAVSACGDVAPYVAVLGGTSYLVATSESFSSNEIAKDIFGEEEMSRPKVLWSGQGNTKISGANFSSLIEMKPDVCFVLSGQSLFDNSQLETLKTNKISIVTLPKLNTLENIKLSVHIIAEVLGDPNGDSTKKDASVMEEKYLEWLNDSISELISKNRQFSGCTYIDFNNDVLSTGEEKTNTSQNGTGQFTLLLSDWDESASYTLGDINGYGVAVASSGYSNSPVSYAMSLGGAANNAALSRYIPRQYYVSPFGLDNTVRLTVNGRLAKWDLSTSQSMVEASEGLNGTKSGIGSEKYKTIIAGTRLVKEKMQTNQLWEHYPMIETDGGKYNGVMINGNLVRSYVVGDYSVVVNPGGIGSWITGSPEAFLEGFFVNSVFHGDYSPSDLNMKISNFYLTFYGKSPSSSTISKIVGGYER